MAVQRGGMQAGYCSATPLNLPSTILNNENQQLSVDPEAYDLEIKAEE